MTTFKTKKGKKKKKKKSSREQLNVARHDNFFKDILKIVPKVN